MSAPDLAELRRLLAEMRSPGADAELVVMSEADMVAKHLPYLLAKVRAAERLAEVAEVAMCNDDMDLIDAIEDFRKAGAP